jgi:TetR/AcrR family transcriptional regulator, acrAB operon repressor
MQRLIRPKHVAESSGRDVHVRGSLRQSADHTKRRMDHTTKRQRQALVTRNKILDSAEVEFFRRGTDRTSLDDVAHAAGMTRGAIYAHFENKMALLDALFERAALPLDPFTVPLNIATESPVKRLRKELEVRLRDVLRTGPKRRLYGIAFSAPNAETGRVLSRESLGEAGQFARQCIERALYRARTAEELDHELNLEAEAGLIHACLTGYFHRSLLDPPAVGKEGRLAAEIVSHVLRPLTAGMVNKTK